MGLLEKHKDYVERAKNYHVKERRLKGLRTKAAFRNPDEFYFKMLNASTEVELLFLATLTHLILIRVGFTKLKLAK